MGSAGSPLRIALVQMRCEEDPRRNLARALDRIAAAAREGARLVCLPELFRSRYFCQAEDHEAFALAEPVPGPSTQALGEAARAHGVVVVGSLFERRAAGVYHNTACVLDVDGRLVGRYRKMHVPDDPLYYEKFYFTPGDLGFPVFPTAAGRIGLLVCWDQWFPEAARLVALAGAELVVCPTAIGWHDDERDELGPSQHDAWETVQRGHAIANGVFLAATNRVGREGTIDFWGASFACGPFGEVLGRAGHEDEATVIADLDLGRIERTRQHWPFLRDRRIDAYGGLLHHPTPGE